MSFGDLTVIVGSQATGKSIFLQTLKLLIDRDQIHDMFTHHNMSFGGRPEAFLDAYFGRGIASGWGTKSSMVFNDEKVDLVELSACQTCLAERRVRWRKPDWTIPAVT